MNNGKISPLQGFMVLALFVTSGGMTFGSPSRNMPLILLVATLISLPLYGIYRYIAMGEHPLDLFDSFPPWASKALSLFYAGMGMVLAAVVMGVFTRFILSVGIGGGNTWLFALLLAVVLFFMAQSKVEALGHMSAIFFPLVAILLTLPLISALKTCDFANLLPIMRGDLVSEGSTLYSVTNSLFAHGFFAIMLLAPKVQGRQPWTWTAIATGVFLAVASACNIALLGFPSIMNYFFPFYTAASAVNMDNYFQRMEMFVAAAFLLCQLFKAGLCIAFAKTALEKVFPRFIGKTTLPITAVAVLISQLCLGSLLTMSELLSDTKYLFIVPLYIVPVFLAVYKKLRTPMQSVK